MADTDGAGASDNGGGTRNCGLNVVGVGVAEGSGDSLEPGGGVGEDVDPALNGALGAPAPGGGGGAFFFVSDSGVTKSDKSGVELAALANRLGMGGSNPTNGPPCLAM